MLSSILNLVVRRQPHTLGDLDTPRHAYYALRGVVDGMTARLRSNVPYYYGRRRLRQTASCAPSNG
jgi:hypothetical protein